VKQPVLVVEDNPANRELLCDWLEARQFEVRAAGNLPEAFAALAEQAPAIVLLDIQLGADDGLALAKWIRQKPRLRHVPILAVTAHAMVTDHERVLQAGCNACISKPIDFQLLRQQLDGCLAVAAVREKDAEPPKKGRG
jgi:two-component system, cell cycle response regulator DivK